MYMAPSRVLATLIPNADGTFTFTRKQSQMTLVFSQRGDLISEKDRNGYTTSFAYSNGQLTGITDPAGRTLTLGYTGTHVTSASDVAGRSVSYGYDSNGNLTNVTHMNRGNTTFSYSVSHLLTVMN